MQTKYLPDTNTEHDHYSSPFGLWFNKAQIGNVYSRIPLIPHPYDRRGAALSNSGLSDSYCTDLTSDMWFLLLLNTWAAKLIGGLFHLDITFSCWFRAIRVPVFSTFSAVSTMDAEGQEYCGSGYITKVNVDTLFEAFFNICDYFPHLTSNRISGVYQLLD